MRRMAQLIAINLAYGLFCIWHLCLSGSMIANGFVSYKCVVVLSHVVPSFLLILGYISIAVSKFSRLHAFEKTAIWCICILATFYHFYIALSGFSPPNWVLNHNLQTGIFVGITGAWYSKTLINLHKQGGSK